MLRGSALMIAAALALAPACSPPPDTGGVGVVQMALVKDSYIFQPGVTQALKLYVLKASTPAGRLACSDIRGAKFDPNDPRYEQLANPPGVGLAQHDPGKEVVIDAFEVPAGERFLIVARGLSQYAGTVFPVAEGCKDDLVVSAGESAVVDIDVLASTGADCKEVADCQTGLGCQLSGDAFAGGYCAQVGCTGDAQCPPGSRCVNDGAGGLCLRGCAAIDTINDCTTPLTGQANQMCVGRKGPGGICAPVCVYPLWNQDGACTP